MPVGIDLGRLDPLGIYDPALAATLRDRIAYITRVSDSLAKKCTDPPTTKKQIEAYQAFVECFDTASYAAWYLAWKEWAKKSESSTVWFLPLIIRDTQEIVERNTNEFKGYYAMARKCGLELPPFASSDDLFKTILESDYKVTAFGAGIGFGTIAAAAVALYVFTRNRN